MSKTIHAKSGHTLFVKEIKRKDLPPTVLENEHSKGFKTFYVVKNWDDEGVVFMYLAKGLKGVPEQICVFYPKGEFWVSYGKTIVEAINGAQEDGWMYA